MMKTLNLISIIAMSLISAHGDESRIVHTSTNWSTLASDVTTYFAGDTAAFNTVLATLAQEHPSAPPTIPSSGLAVQPIPNVFVYIYSGTGRQYFNQCLAGSSGKKTVIHRVPAVPAEVISKTKPVFDFDWIVTKSSNKTDRTVSVILFTDGYVDLFGCELPANVALKIGKQATLVVEPASKDNRR